MMKNNHILYKVLGVIIREYIINLLKLSTEWGLFSYYDSRFSACFVTSLHCFAQSREEPGKALRLTSFMLGLPPSLCTYRWIFLLLVQNLSGCLCTCQFTCLSYFGSPFSSWIPLPNCSHHGSRFQRRSSEGQRADSLRRSSSGTSNSHSCLPRVSIRHHTRQLDRKE